ncbi:MAG: glycosyltransferase [Bacteroides sp.]|nr:glycosyltransferase [Bacteroides sp.]MCM1379250.1 glycosyltransferase [Bacteroides sp.]MCM1445092.1 glycosyltransferase [Prevotella sp.]
MLISVITITYNAALTLPATLASVEAQTFRDFEYLIVDGASTDGTVEIARVCPIAQVVSEPDRGLYDAMNKGLHRARGRYVLFLNAGDAFPSPNTLQQYADAIASAPCAPGVVYGQTRLVDSNRHYVGERHYRAPQELTAKSFLGGMVVCHQAMLVRRDLAPDYDLRYRFSADYDWGCKILKASPLNVYINDYVADYLSEGLTTANRRSSLMERFRSMTANYGLLPALFSHFRILFRIIKRA